MTKYPLYPKKRWKCIACLFYKIHFIKYTFTRYAVTKQVVANCAGAASGVLRGGEAELWAASVVDLAQVSSWMLSTTNNKCKWLPWVVLYLHWLIDLWKQSLPFWPSRSYTFMCTTPLVLFLRITKFWPSLLVTVPSCPNLSSAHQSLPPVTINDFSLNHAVWT